MSNTKNTGGPAYPQPENYAAPGMTLRDHFAGLIMQGWMSDPQVQPLSTTSWDEWAFNTSVNAYKVADAMLKAREQ
jgi:hypothetical protein